MTDALLLTLYVLPIVAIIAVAALVADLIEWAYNYHSRRANRRRIV